MEYRERWWTDGWRNAEANVGMAMDRIQVGEHHAAMEMNAQVNSRVDTLRATQERAERASVAMQDQQQISNDLAAYVDKLHAQGRTMINNSEQKHWNIVRELPQARSDLARVNPKPREKYDSH